MNRRVRAVAVVRRVIDEHRMGAIEHFLGGDVPAFDIGLPLAQQRMGNAEQVEQQHRQGKLVRIPGGFGLPPNDFRGHKAVSTFHQPRHVLGGHIVVVANQHIPGVRVKEQIVVVDVPVAVAGGVELLVGSGQVIGDAATGIEGHLHPAFQQIHQALVVFLPQGHNVAKGLSLRGKNQVLRPQKGLVRCAHFYQPFQNFQLLGQGSLGKVPFEGHLRSLGLHLVNLPLSSGPQQGQDLVKNPHPEDRNSPPAVIDRSLLFPLFF